MSTTFCPRSVKHFQAQQKTCERYPFEGPAIVKRAARCGAAHNLTRHRVTRKVGAMSSLGNATDVLKTRSSLLERVRDTRDTAAWDELVSLYRPLLVGYVASRGLREHDVQDVVQEILLKLWRLLPKFELDRDRGKFRTWLYQVATSVVIDWARRRKREGQPAEELENYYQQAEAAAQSDSLNEFMTEHRKRVLAFAMEQLRPTSNPKTWQCFEQHALQGRPAAEVAAELEMTVNNVYVNTSRVLSKIRERCAEYMESMYGDGSVLSA